MSRAADVTDWDYGYDDISDPTRPVAGTVTDAGYVGNPILALVPFSDDFLLFGCEEQLWLLRGDPAGGGMIDALSREVGIIGPNTWCKLPDGAIAFLSRSGIYAMRPGAESYPQPLSRELLPQELRDVDVVANAVSMAYDGRNRGIHLFITPSNGSTGAHWFIDWVNKGLFPVAVPDAMQPFCQHAYAADLGENKTVLLGGYDGYVREYDDDEVDDDGTTLASYVAIGPLRLGAPGQNGILTELAGVLDEQSNDLTWEIMVGDTSEAAANSASAKASGTWVAGFNPPSSPRLAAHAAKLKLSATDAWALESAHGTIRPGGRIR